jgi:hypothetical protein
LRKADHSRTGCASRLGLERLEDRLVLSNYTVTNVNYSGTGSLGAAITAAINSDDSQAQIDFSVPNNSTIALTAADADPSTTVGPTAYVISGSGVAITIDGSGAPGLTIDGSGAIRVFAVTATASLTLEGLTVSGGLAQGFDGGGGGGGGAGGGGAGLGGAVYDEGGSFTAEGVTFTNDVARGGNGVRSGGTDGMATGSDLGGGGGGLSGAGQSGGAGGAGGLSGGGQGGQSGGNAGKRGGPGGFGGGGGGGVRTGVFGGGGGKGGFGGGGGGSGGFGSGGGSGGFGGGSGGQGGITKGGGGGGGAGLGGGIFSNGGSLTLVNDTFTGDTAAGGVGVPASHGSGASSAGSGYGGAVFAVNGSLDATFVTFSGNTAQDGAGNALDGTDAFVLTDQAVDGVQGNGRFDGTFIDDILGQSGTTTTSDFASDNINYGNPPPNLTAQYDLIGDNSPSIIGTGLPTGGPGIVIGDDPMLGALASNGGPTPTMALMPTSPVIAAGISADDPGTDDPITTDQRDETRAATPSLGAYEVPPTAPTVKGLNPKAGPQSGGTSVTITGTGFTGASAVDFGKIPAMTFSVDNATSITADSSAGTGVVDVTVVNTGNTSGASSADQFTYMAPTITISPGSLDLGTTTAGTAGTEESYTISGSGLAANVAVTAPDGVEVSDDGGAMWDSSLTLTQRDGTVIGTTIEARISASAAVGGVAGSIANSSTGATTRDVALGGTVKVETPPGTLVSSIPQSSYGQDVTIAATFTATEVGTAPMTGTVAFYDGTTYLGTEPLVGTSGMIAADSRMADLSTADASPTVSGTASLSTSPLAVGSHDITAVYSGDANYSSSTTASSLSIQVAQAVTTLTLAVSNTSRETTLSATVVATSPGTPTVVGSVDFYEGDTLIGTEPVSKGVATLTIAPPSPGGQTVRAIFTGGGAFSSSASQPVSTDGPRATGALRYGYHDQKTYLVLDFDGPLDPTSAEDIANYTISGPDNRHGHRGHRVKVGSAIYNTATNSVTLVPATRLNIHETYTLTINGTTPFGVANPSGMLLDGAANGKPGSNYVTSLTRRNLAGRAKELATTGQVDAARKPEAVSRISTQHTHTTLHDATGDHPLDSGSLRLPKSRARR